MKSKLLTFIFLTLIIILPFFSFTSLSKYTFNDSFLAFNLNIDTTIPKITLISFENSNTQYPLYANYTHIIKAKIKITEEHTESINLDTSHIKIKIGDTFTDVSFVSMECISSNAKETIYEIAMADIYGDGLFKLCFLEGAVIDTSQNTNKYQEFTSNITIDNTPPNLEFEEKLIENNFSTGIIYSNEPIQNIDGWDISNNNTKLCKIYANPVEYELTLKDYAQNPSNILVSIKKASNILLEYAVLDTKTRDSQIKSSGNVAGEELLSQNTPRKAEALFIRTSGKIDSSFLKGSVFVYTHLGEGSNGVCDYSELRYTYGYNPESGFRTINKENTAFLGGSLFTQFGGIGINYPDYGLPEEISKKYLYGLSSVKFTLDNYSTYSIVYQIYIIGHGWLPAVSNGTESVYNYTKPFSKIRINLVPTSEKQYLIDYWNKDC